MSFVALSIRPEQSRVLSEAAEQQFLEKMRQSVAIDRADAVAGSIQEGRRRGLATANELRQFLELWIELDGAWPAWMEEVWRDKWISSPGARLDRILAVHRHRQAVEVHNRELRRRFEEGQL